MSFVQHLFCEIPTASEMWCSLKLLELYSTITVGPSFALCDINLRRVDPASVLAFTCLGLQYATRGQPYLGSIVASLSLVIFRASPIHGYQRANVAMRIGGLQRSHAFAHFDDQMIRIACCFNASLLIPFYRYFQPGIVSHANV